MSFQIKSLKNFAAIKKIEDEVRLNDLTIFMGDNSAGKSYLAILFDRLVNIEKEIDNVLALKGLKNSFVFNECSKQIETVMQNGGSSLEISLAFSKQSLLELNSVVKEVIIQFIRNHFGNVITKSFDIEIDYDINYGLKLFLKKTETETLFEFLITIEAQNNTFVESKFIIEKKRFKKNILLEQVLELILFSIIKLSIAIPSSIYLPASRTGYLHTYNILIKYALEKTFGKQESTKELLHLPDWILDFVKELAKPSLKEVDENILAKLLEESLINGKVKVSKESNEIEFLIKNKKGNYNKKIELPYTSSSVSELIPLVAFLKKGLITKNKLLIIEEPEAHLSFENQKKVARLLSVFIENGIKVLITTHSDYLVFELNNMILANNLSQDKRPKEYKKYTLDPKKVTVYNFLLSNNTSSTVQRVKVSEEGIDNPYITKSLIDRIKSMKKLYELMDEEYGSKE